VDLHEAINQLIVDTKGPGEGGALAFSSTSSIGLFLPEIILCLTIVLMLLVRVFRWGRRVDAFYFVLVGSGLALYLTTLGATAPQQRVEIFTGMLVYDTFTIFMRAVLLLFVLLFAVLTKLTGIPDREDGPDVYTLVLGATLGMCLMVSANHLLIVFLAIEMASVPSYALAALMKGRREASEAALKYAIYGAGTAGVMLYGISLLAGLANSAHLPTIAANLAQQMPTMGGDERMVLALAGLMLMVGLAFKLSAVPFHLWCPDVFEGATAEVDAFLSVASKAAALGLLIRVAIGIGVVVPSGYQAGYAGTGSPESVLAHGDAPTGLFSVEDETRQRESGGFRTSRDVAGSSDVESAPTTGAALAPVRDFVGRLVALLAIVTCTFGNLAAYGQTNIKRLLAYSTIAHAGYMMMAIPPIMALADVAPDAAERAGAALAIYVVLYLFMNLGAFAVVAFMRNVMRSEQIADYGGLLRCCPAVAVCFSLILFSLLGIPPLAGFIGKFAIFASLAQGYQVTSEGYLLLLLIVGGLNTAISLYYYLRLVKIMTIDSEPETRGPVALPLVSSRGVYLLALTVPLVVLFFRWDLLNRYVLEAARQLLG
jgi:NADH-quinone oxidoreductase subunit N